MKGRAQIVTVGAVARSVNAIVHIAHEPHSIDLAPVSVARRHPIRWTTAGAIALAVLRHSAGAQTVHLGVVMYGPRERLEREWTDDTRQLERAYCVTGWWAAARHVARTPIVQDDSVFRVIRIEPADMTTATPTSAEFECTAGAPELHVHPPTTCAGDDPATCISGGLNAFSCQPSREDLVKLARRRDPFAVVQCDRRTFRFYYPSEYGPPPAAVLTGTRRSLGNVTPAMAAAVPGSSVGSAP
jgi:hypothetical protein